MHRLRHGMSATHPMRKTAEVFVPSISIRAQKSARAKRTERFIRTVPKPPDRPITARTAKPRFNPMQMSQQICPEMQTLSIEFGLLTKVTRNFFTANSILTLKPDLPALYAALTLAFDSFARQCTLIFSNLNRTPSLREWHKGAPLYDLGHTLTSRWVDFIGQINGLADADIEPYKKTVHDNFVVFRNEIKRLIVSVTRTQYSSRKLVAILNYVKTLSIKCEDGIQTVFAQVKDPEFRRLDTSVQENQLLLLMEKTQDLFEKEIPMDGVPIRERSRINALMMRCCATISEALQSMTSFHGQIADIKTQILVTNQELTKVHEQLQLPFAVTLSFSDPPKTESCNEINDEK